MNEKYLSKEELERLSKFLKERFITQAEVSRILGVKASTVGYYFHKPAFKRDTAIKLVKKLKERANQGFDSVNFEIE